MSEKNQDNFFSEENEVKPNWFKFTKIGDAIKGTYIGVSYKDAQDVFPAQKIYELKTDDGIIYVGFNVNKIYIHNAMKNAKIGQIVGFKYDSDYQTEENKKRGMNPAKTIKVFLGGMDENYQQTQPVDNEIDISQIPL